MEIEGHGLGRLEPVETRTVWANEAHDFTPWLLSHPEDLGEVLGMDLQLTEAEHAVGGFSLDLVGVDGASGERVIVENQLEVSDHTHLGQLLTYAAGTDPTNVVWLCAQFREEHRAALDWLNTRTDDTTRFFGVEVSVVRIGDSLPAPLFRLVAAPNDWGKRVRSATVSSTRENWTESEFLDAVDRYCDATTREGVLAVMEHTKAMPGFDHFYWGNGRYPSVTVVMETEVGQTQPWSVYTGPEGRTVFAVNYDWIHKQGRAFDADTTARFVADLADLPGVAAASVNAAAANWRKRPSIPAAPMFADRATIDTLTGTLDRLYGAQPL